MQPAGTHKYGFRIKTHSGPVVEHLLIHGRDEAEATRKLERMYPNCRVLECVPPATDELARGSRADLAAR